MKRLFTIIIFLFSLLICTEAQVKGVMSSYRDSILNDFNSFRRTVLSDYEQYRNRVNKDYLKFLNGAWQNCKASPGLEIPEDSVAPIPPIYFDDSMPFNVRPPVSVLPDSLPYVLPQPTPIVPIDVAPRNKNYRSHEVSLYNTNFRILYPIGMEATCKTVQNEDISSCWESISFSGIEATLSDLLKIREDYCLCDLLYLQLLDKFTHSVYKSDCNSRIVLLSYLFAHSGYKTRLAKNHNRLYLLYGSEHYIYDETYFIIDNEMFYPYNCNETTLEICNAFIPGEQSLSLFITAEPKLKKEITSKRELVSSNNIKLFSYVNEPLIHFYNSYPASCVNKDPLTRWAIIANTPLSEVTKQAVYPDLFSAIAGKGVFEQVNILLNFVQTAFTYEYDDNVWGYDRAFFAEEVFKYPYSDCEDRTILFTRLVRDLVGLNCAIVYYPGHLAAAVLFDSSEEIIGDAVFIDNKRYIICDPTYVNSSVGMSMPELDYTNVRVMLLGQ